MAGSNPGASSGGSPPTNPPTNTHSPGISNARSKPGKSKAPEFQGLWPAFSRHKESLFGLRNRRGPLEEKADGLKAISPVTFVDRTDPPVLTFHGTEDRTVPFEHAEILHAALKKSQIPNVLFPMKGAGHGVGGDVEKVFSTLAAFHEAYLRGSRQPLLAYEDFDGDASRWEPTDTAAWKVVKNEGRSFYSLIKKRSDYEPKVRSPYNYSLLRDVEVGDFVLDVDLKSTHEPYGHQDLCLFFGYQDASHFYYVHMGRQADAHANSIFLVNDEARVSIAQERTEGTDWSRGWHRARIKRDVTRGTIEVFFDDMQKPIMKTTDQTFLRGRIGIGSFDDTGNFDAIRLWGPRPEQERLPDSP
ncbi:MAG: prolyl oligopeptidase family serine peptidase [Planctomycetota bacterium]|nr:prolyl oligopeptidase family serine peptidase [Planctomycetota bacterium]